jgi:hypothetical protein
LALMGWESVLPLSQIHILDATGRVGLLAMPLSAISTWSAGELATGPTRRSWLPMILVFVLGELGFIVGTVVSYLLDRAIRSILGVSQLTIVWLLPLLTIPFLFGGVLATLAYLGFRGEYAGVAEGREQG